MEAYRWAEKNTRRRSDNRDSAIKNINEPTPVIFICQVEVLSVTKVCQKNFTYVLKRHKNIKRPWPWKIPNFFFCTHNPPLLALIKKYLKNTVAAVLLVRSTLPLESTNTAR